MVNRRVRLMEQCAETAPIGERTEISIREFLGHEKKHLSCFDECLLAPAFTPQAEDELT